MEKPLSKQITSNVGTQTKSTKTNLVGTFIYSVLVALIMGGIFQAISLPKACNEDPQSPIMKLESQIQEEFTEIDNWLENNLGTNLQLFIQYLKNVLIFLTLSLTYFIVSSLYKDSAIETLTLFVSLFGCWIMIFKFMRDYYFQDSSENCKIELTKNLHEVQLVCMFHFVMLAFIAFQQFLTKNCEK